MCQVCRHTHCLSVCPNAPDPPAVTTCARCGESVTPGYEYARIDGLDYCAECIEDMPYCELVPLLGGEWDTVLPDHIIKCIDEFPYCELVTMAGHDWKMAIKEDIYDGYDG